MIRMTYDPIMGVRYYIDDADPRTESQRAVYAKLQEQFNRSRHIQAKQLRHQTNTKQK